MGSGRAWSPLGKEFSAVYACLFVGLVTARLSGGGGGSDGGSVGGEAGTLLSHLVLK